MIIFNGYIDYKWHKCRTVCSCHSKVSLSICDIKLNFWYSLIVLPTSCSQLCIAILKNPSRLAIWIAKRIEERSLSHSIYLDSSGACKYCPTYKHYLSISTYLILYLRCCLSSILWSKQLKAKFKHIQSLVLLYANYYCNFTQILLLWRMVNVSILSQA